MLIGTFKAAEMCLQTILSERSTDNSFDFKLGWCSDCRNISRVISRNRMHLSFTAKAVKTYSHASSECLYSNTFLKRKKKDFIWSLWRAVCRIVRKMLICSIFLIRLQHSTMRKCELFRCAEYELGHIHGSKTAPF